MLPALPGAPRLVASAPSYSEGHQECPPRVEYSPEIDASKFTLHILSDTPGGFQWLKYILLMLCNATCCLGDGKCVILHQRVRGFVKAVRAVHNTRVFLMETSVVADETNNCWRSVDTHFQNGAGSMLLPCLTIQAAYISFTNACNQSRLRLPKMYNKKSFTLYWLPYSGLVKEYVSLFLESIHGQSIKKGQWCTKLNMLRLTVQYLSATIYKNTQ